jgi:hypothetical protein
MHINIENTMRATLKYIQLVDCKSTVVRLSAKQMFELFHVYDNRNKYTILRETEKKMKIIIHTLIYLFDS